jgi:rRNA processing protein Krr1/Pno1
MSADPTLETLETEADEENAPDPAARVLGWRIEQLIGVGFDSDDALALAFDRTVDLHEAIELVRRGCPPQTAFRILI